MTMAESSEAKLDRILLQLDGLTTGLAGVKADIASVKTDVETLKLSVDSIEERVENKIDQLKDQLKGSLTSYIDSEIATAKTEVRTEIEEQIDDKILELDIDTIMDKQAAMQREIDELRALVDGPYNPDRSVVIYGLRIGVDETLDAKVDWLMRDILQLEFDPKIYEKTESRGDDRPGVIKMELRSKWEKIAMLKAKRKCLDHDSSKNVIIRSCDSHDSRVSKINARFFLNKLPDGKDYIITSHGLIRKKDNPNPEGGEGSADADGTDGGVAPESTLPGLGDNTGDQNQNIPTAPEGSRAVNDQSAGAIVEPSIHEAGRDLANGGGRGNRGGTRGGGRGGGAGRGNGGNRSDQQVKEKGGG